VRMGTFMSRNMLLVVLTATGSALCWWPVIMQPNLDLPSGFPLVLVALGTALSTTLSDEGWLQFMIASIAGSFVGICCGFWIWWPTDGIEASYVPLGVAVAMLRVVLVAVVSLIAGLVLSVPVWMEKRRHAVWLLFICGVALGPVTVALTPPLVAYKVARNDRLAAERIQSLNHAVEQTMAEADGPTRICDGQALRQHYSGPPLRETDWQYLAANSVQDDGYVFWINCHDKNGYSIDAQPARGKADGTRHFYAGAWGVAGCGMAEDRAHCVPAAK